MKAIYDNEPSKLEAVGNGSYLYRWNIEQIEIEETLQWSCDEVTVWSPLTSNKITQAVISEIYDINQEQKLLNEYNSAKLGLYDTNKANEKTASYLDFLNQRNILKTQIDNDCEILGIK